MKYKIGIFGSSAGDMSVTLPKAQALGQVLKEYADSVILITGACPGLPYAVAHEAAEAGVEVWGFSPVFDEAGQKQFTPNDDLSIYSKIIYMPANFEFKNDDLLCKKYRNIIST